MKLIFIFVCFLISLKSHSFSFDLPDSDLKERPITMVLSETSVLKIEDKKFIKNYFLKNCILINYLDEIESKLQTSLYIDVIIEAHHLIGNTTFVHGDIFLQFKKTKEGDVYKFEMTKFSGLNGICQNL